MFAKTQRTVPRSHMRLGHGSSPPDRPQAPGRPSKRVAFAADPAKARLMMSPSWRGWIPPLIWPSHIGLEAAKGSCPWYSWVLTASRLRPICQSGGELRTQANEPAGVGETLACTLCSKCLTVARKLVHIRGHTDYRSTQGGCGGH